MEQPKAKAQPQISGEQYIEDFRRAGHEAVDWIAEYLGHHRIIDRVIMPAVTQWNHPRFFAYFACTGSTPAILGEMLAAALNINGLHWKTSPAVAELEQVTLDWLRQWMGLQEDWFGIVYDIASTGSMHAIVRAREMVAPETRVNASQPDLTLHTSD